MEQVSVAPSQGVEERLKRIWGEDLFSLLGMMGYRFEKKTQKINDNIIAVAYKTFFDDDVPVTIFVYCLKSSLSNSNVISISVDNDIDEVFC